MARLPASSRALVLGPVLRRVEGDRATVWVETDHQATVEIRAGETAHGAARTFCVHGHHYALVVVDGLPPAASTPYEVLIDGEVAWPLPGDRYPPPAIRTRAPGEPTRLVFGSCRKATPYSVTHFPPDALDAYAVRLATEAGQPHPDLLVLLGDQVYADETPDDIQHWLKRRRHHRPDAPATQVIDFHEYTKLYLDSWSDPETRWLLANVPSTMIFDDHEIIDDWNSSARWRATITQQDWWSQRIQAGLASYWVYQHLGNLAPSVLAEDPIYAAVSSTPDATGILDDFGTRAERERGSYRWSYTLDIDRTRLVVLDNRAGRDLTPGRRSMLPESEWEWFFSVVQGDYDHLVVGSSLPWLLPPAIHYLEAISERLAESPRRLVADLAERTRLGLDLEHWASFGRSFDALSVLLGEIGTGPSAPATISVLSGDVHHSYAARALYGPEVISPVYQLTCSPVHNEAPKAIRPAMRLGWSRPAARALRAAARAIGLRRPIVPWRKLVGPYFGNAVATLVHDGRESRVTIEGTRPDKHLTMVGQLRLDRSGERPAPRR
jgi:PhoD-like phosphatase